MQKDKKSKSLLKRMADFMKANSFKMLILSGSGYILYRMINDFKFNSEKWFAIENTLGLFAIGIYAFIVIYILFQMKSDDDLDSDIRNLTREKLIYEKMILKNKCEVLLGNEFQKIQQEIRANQKPAEPIKPNFYR